MARQGCQQEYKNQAGSPSGFLSLVSTRNLDHATEETEEDRCPRNVVLAPYAASFMGKEKNRLVNSRRNSNEQTLKFFGHITRANILESP